MKSYLKEFHNEDITDLLNKENNASHLSINVDLTNLQKHRPELYTKIIQNVWNCINEWDNALLDVQKQLSENDSTFLDPDYQIKENCHVKFINLPQSEQLPKGVFPNNKHIGIFVQIKGNVVRMTQTRLLEFKKEYACTKCKEIFVFEAKYNKLYVFDVPKSCTSDICKGTLYPKNSQPLPKYCMDYQEIRVQELLSDKNVPSSINVTLENDLTDICQPGDGVTICGTIERRWKTLVLGKRTEVVITLRAISIYKNEEKLTYGKDVLEQLFLVRTQWEECVDRYGQLNCRDILLKSICPEVYGMYLIKLSIALSLCSGIKTKLPGGLVTRGHSHLLLIGDPGLAKSKLLKSASNIAIRSIHTTGMGCSTAGLTVAAIKTEGEWELEAGALVLADGGVCCIDEFNLIREHDRTSIHEAMEQQTISIAKAGLVCKLSTRCVVIASTNPRKLYKMSENEGTSSVNTGVGAALMSRFDLVFILRDECNEDWDSKVTDHILKACTTIDNDNPTINLHNTKVADINENQDLYNTEWDLERLRSHFLAIRDINPQLTSTANEILGTYYQYCRLDGYRDKSRTSVRLLDSLSRLTQSHAKLLFRNNANGLDAIVIVQLMESSWGFGRMLKPKDIIRSELPIGPNENDIREVLSALNLMHLENEIIEDLRNMTKIYTSPSKKTNKNLVNSSKKTFEKDNLQANHSKNDIINNESSSSSSPSLIRNVNESIEKDSNDNHSSSVQMQHKRNSDNDRSILNINDLENIFGYQKTVKKLRISDENKENHNLNDEKESDKIEKSQSPVREDHYSFIASTQIEKSGSSNNGIIDWNLNFNSDESINNDENDLDFIVSQSNEFDDSMDEEEFEKIRQSQQISKKSNRTEDSTEKKSNLIKNSKISNKSESGYYNSEKETDSDDHKSSSQRKIFNQSIGLFNFDDKDLEIDFDFDNKKPNCSKDEIQNPKSNYMYEKLTTATAVSTSSKMIQSATNNVTVNNQKSNNSNINNRQIYSKFKEPIPSTSKAAYLTVNDDNDYDGDGCGSDQRNNKTPNKIEGNQNKKPKISPIVMRKLEIFKNPDYEQKTFESEDNFENEKNEIIENRLHENNKNKNMHEHENENVKDNDHDSAYDTISINNFMNKFVIPLKDDDLSCLDLDF